jgi:TolB-like protein/DNA-binding winged helix-turn-helix (wHTH) protein/Tfp pilus assembly protein PilF
MDPPVPSDVFLFEAFRFDRRAGALFRRDEGGALVPVTIGSRALAVLDTLVARQDDLVSKDEIMHAVWPETVVEDNNLTVQISALRRVRDQGRAGGSCIQTVSGRGYRFVPPVTRAGGLTAASISTPGNGSGGPVVAAALPEPPSAMCPIGALAPGTRPPAPHPLRRAAIAIVAGALCLAAIAVVVANWRSLSPGKDGSAPRLSIVVLPFTNLGNNPDQQYFADGVTEDLTTDLSQIEHMFVIAHSSAAGYRDKAVGAREIGRELGVRYILEGSVQRAGDRVRINAQLIEAETSAHLWAERFDRSTSDLFDVQEELTRRIAQALNAALVAVEAARPIAHLDALDNILRGRAALNNGWTRDNYARAIGFFERALALDPRSVEAQNRWAGVLVNRVFREQTDTAAADIARADELVERSLAASPGNAFAHDIKGDILRIEGRCPEAIPEFERAIAANPNLADAYSNLGRCKYLTGSIDEAIPLEAQALRLSPRGPFVGTIYTRIGTVHLLQSRTDEAIAWFKKALLPARSIASIRDVHLFLASAYGLKGELERAALEHAELRKLSGGDTLNIAWVKSHLGRPETSWSYAVPKTRALYETTFFSGLRKAGMPEE